MFRLIVLAVCATAPASLEFSDGWIREAPPTAQVLAGYGRIHNASAKLVAIAGAHSADFDRVEIHEMTMANGVMKMRALEKVEIAAGGDLVLESGATHLMLIGPHRRLKTGDTVEIVFEPQLHATLVVK